ncbi:MAG: hypothetical protein ACREE7_07555, partial [Dongiaceae bacterium]
SAVVCRAAGALPAATAATTAATTAYHVRLVMVLLPGSDALYVFVSIGARVDPGAGDREQRNDNDDNERDGQDE